jgi:eukaryotic-like serine/threonine-protein kinase
MDIATEINFKHTLATAFADANSEFFLPGTQLGPFTVESMLGEGGMGQVYKVTQNEPVRRDVALKLSKLPAELHDDPHARQRGELLFELEKQALASLNHPNIAKLYEAGSIPGNPPRVYLAMEWIDGATLEQHVLERCAKLPARDAIREVLTLFADTCLGVHHAHQRQLIHRDLKPNNILVQAIDGRMVPKVIDFGVAVGARAQPGMTAGTREYMSPEQFDPERRLDARSDVHALGVSLAEMLMLALRQKLPKGWSSNSLRSALHKCSSSEAVAPYNSATSARRSSYPHPQPAHSDDEKQASEQLSERLAKLLSAPLQAVLNKAVAAEPDDRYSSADAFAHDLRALLRHQPVRAYPGSVWYRAQLFWQRNRLAVSLASVAVLALLAGLSAALYGLQQAKAERSVALAQAERAQLTNDFLSDVISGVDPDQAAALDTALMKRILDDAAKRANQLQGKHLLQAEVLRTISRAYSSITEFKSAVTHAEAGLQALAQADPAAHPNLAMELEMALGQAHSGAGDSKAALAASQRACDIAERSQGVDKIDAIDLARCKTAVAWEHYFLGEPTLALQLAQAVNTAINPERDEAADKAYTSNLRILGIALGETGDLISAEKAFRTKLARCQKRHGELHSCSLNASNSLGVNLLQQKRFQQAAEHFQVLLQQSEQLFGKEHQATISVVSNLAGALRQSGQTEASAPHYRRAYALAAKHYGEESRYALTLSGNLANLEIDLKQADLALGRLDQLKPLLEKSFDAHHAIFREHYKSRAKAHTALKQNALAIQAWQQVAQWAQANDADPKQSTLQEAQAEIAKLK